MNTISSLIVAALFATLTIAQHIPTIQSKALGSYVDGVWCPPDVIPTIEPPLGGGGPQCNLTGLTNDELCQASA